MPNDADTLAALQATTDDTLQKDPDLLPRHPGQTAPPCRAHLSNLFTYLPQQPGYNRQLR